MQFKVGGDAQSGHSKGHKKTDIGKSTYVQSLIGMKLLSPTGGILWKVPRTNSKRYSSFKMRVWEKETSKTIVKNVDQLRQQIDNLKRHIVNIDGVDIGVVYTVFNCMNDGKTLNAMAVRVHKSSGRIPQHQKELSTQSCHLCLGTNATFKAGFEVKQENIENILLDDGAAVLHECMRSREHIINAASRKRAIKKILPNEPEMAKNDAIKEARAEICRELQPAVGARLFQPEPEKGGNSNKGEPLRRLTDQSRKTAPILDCSVELLDTMHELFCRIESTEFQVLEYMDILCRKAYTLYMTEYGPYHTISPSLHRTLQHSILYMQHFQTIGMALGETSEQGLEASNYDSKQDRINHSFRGSHSQSNIDVFHKSWWSADYSVLYYHK
jgi:hypothetical protein